jgi:hypothetical protein
VTQIGRNVTGVQGDVSHLTDLDRLFATVRQQQGRLEGGQGWQISREFPGDCDFLRQLWPTPLCDERERNSRAI